jgi:uncharacterized membrane protein
VAPSIDAPEVRAVWVAHALNALALLGTFAVAILGHAGQPERVPVHFDLAGRPDRWAEKSWAMTLAVPLVALAVTALVYGSARLVGWARRHPALVNLPEKAAFLALPPASQEPIWRQLAAMSSWLAVPVTLLFLVLVSLRPGADGRLHVWPLFLPLGLVFVLLAVLTVRLSRAVRRAVSAGR